MNFLKWLVKMPLTIRYYTYFDEAAGHYRALLVSLDDYANLVTH